MYETDDDNDAVEEQETEIAESARIVCDDIEWMRKELSESASYYREWMDEGDRIVGEWRADSQVRGIETERDLYDKQPLSQILWSDMRLEKPALYSRIPQIISQVRYLDSDKVAIKGADILERNTSLQVNYELNNYNIMMNDCVHDAQLVSRGVSKIEIQNEMGLVTHRMQLFPNPQLPDMLMMGDGSEVPAGAEVQQDPSNGSFFIEIQQEELTQQSIIFRHVPRHDFRVSRAKKWADVWYVAFRTYQNSYDLKDNYGVEVAEKANYGKQTDSANKKTYDDQDSQKGDECYQAEVWEIWCKITKRTYTMVAGLDDWAKVEEDPYHLEGFYPCPRPLMFVRDPETLMPTQEYCYYRSHVRMLDQCIQRRYELIDACLVRGFVDQSQVEQLKIVKTIGNLKFTPVNFAQFLEKGGVKGFIDVLVLPEIPQMILQMMQAEEQIKATIYEISGRSDLLRGVSDPRETATAQNIKGSYATLRLGEKQAEVARFARDNAAIAAELIAEHFEDDYLLKAAGILQADELVMASIQMLRDEGARRFKIEIETDSTIAIVEQMQKASFAEYMQSVGSAIPNFMQMIQQFPQMSQYFGQLLLSGSRVFRFGRNFDAALQQGVGAMIQMMSEPPPPPPPDPKVIEMQEKLLIEKEKVAQAWAKLEQAAQEMRQKYSLEKDKLLSEIQTNAEYMRQEMAMQNLKAADSYREKTMDSLKGRI